MIEPVSFVFDADVPRFDGSGVAGLEEMSSFYSTEPRRFLKELLKTAPGGFVDALFGEMAHYKASVFRVPHKDPS